jgi:sec-independent protein translocase protein TatA
MTLFLSEDFKQTFPMTTSDTAAFQGDVVMTQFYPLFINLGPTEMVILLVIVLIVFGANRIPQLMKGMGEGIRNFKQGINEEPSDVKVEAPKK